MEKSFEQQVVDLLPTLERSARYLARDESHAKDLVQDAIVNILRYKDHFQEGTNLKAWCLRILRNKFISILRKKRETGNIDDIPETLFAQEGNAEDNIMLIEARKAMASLPPYQLEALYMSVVLGKTYEEIAESTGVAVGTAKSRVFRARIFLHKQTGVPQGS